MNIKKFRFFYIASLFICIILQKVLYIFHNITYSDIYFSGSGFLSYIPTALSILSELFQYAHCAVTVAGIVFAYKYISGKEAALSFLFADISFIFGIIILALYNSLRNYLGFSGILIGILSLAVTELLYFAVSSALTLLLSKLTKTRKNIISLILSAAVFTIIKTADLTVYVISSFKNIVDVTSSQIISVILDYAQCVILFPFFTVSLALILINMYSKVSKRKAL